MPPATLKFILILAVFCCLPTLRVHAVESATTPIASAPLTEQQQKILNIALTDFRGSANQRATAMKRALSVGPIGATKLLEKIDTDLQPILNQYRALCKKLAQAEYDKRATKTKPEELQKLREQVLKLRDEANLSKEQIVQIAEPAIKKLAEAVLTDRNAILGTHPEVRKLRGQLSVFASYWENCQAILQQGATPAGKNDPPPAPPQFAAYLEQIEQTALLSAAPIDPQAQTIQAANMGQANQLHAEELRCLNDLNLLRILLGLKPLEFDPLLLVAARGHSADMHSQNFFDHVSPVAGKKTFTDRAKLAGTDASGENIYMGSGSGSAANEAWFHSPGHFKNMFADHRRVGIGKSNQHWTELFGR